LLITFIQTSIKREKIKKFVLFTRCSSIRFVQFFGPLGIGDSEHLQALLKLENGGLDASGGDEGFWSSNLGNTKLFQLIVFIQQIH
jgi:hypothetical protein